MPSHNHHSPRPFLLVSIPVNLHALATIRLEIRLEMRTRCNTTMERLQGRQLIETRWTEGQQAIEDLECCVVGVRHVSAIEEMRAIVLALEELLELLQLGGECVQVRLLVCVREAATIDQRRVFGANVADAFVDHVDACCFFLVRTMQTFADLVREIAHD